MKIGNIKIKNIGIAGIGILLLNLFSCNDNEKGIKGPDGSQRQLSFKASVEEVPEISTRALTQTPVAVQYTNFPDNFYICIQGEKPETNGTTELTKDFSAYGVPANFKGQLVPVMDQKTLNWFTADGIHTFWSWTLPWIDDEEAVGAESSDPAYPYNGEIELELQNTTEATVDGIPSWNNGAVLERFIGATSDPGIDHSYFGTGEDLPLQFRHLVSRINIITFTVYTANGGEIANLDGTITFYGMPTKGTLYTQPEKEGENGAKINLQPYVVADKDNIPDEGLTFYVNKSATNGNKALCYIMPEVDFSNVLFKVELNDADLGGQGGYWGDFSQITFSRTTNGTNYDDPDNKTGTGGIKDGKILHAGEYMNLRLYLYEGSGPGVGVQIQDWSSSSTTAEHHINPGIYNNAELADFVTSNNLDNKKQLYGEDDTFYLYTNAQLPYSVLPVDDGYLFNGMGYNINMVADEEGYIVIGNVIDVYLSVTVGDTVYKLHINEDGDVEIWDPVANMFIPTTFNTYSGPGNGKKSTTINPQTLLESLQGS